MNLLTFNGAQENNTAVLEWFADHQTPQGLAAAHWFRIIRSCGSDVLELLADGQPTACLGAYPFAYVGAYKAHTNVGFFHGADLHDPAALLEGNGKRMRHVKVRPDKTIDADALEALIRLAYDDIKQKVATL